MAGDHAPHSPIHLDSGAGTGPEGDFFADFVEKLRENMDPAETGTVLVVDDAKLMRDLVTEFIRKAAPLVNVVTAENGRDALGKLAWIRQTAHADPLLIITDLDMPEMDGWELVEELRKMYRAEGSEEGIPLIVMSSTDGEKRSFFRRRSLSDQKESYWPLIAVAKSTCLDPRHYDAIGNEGLVAWIDYFLRRDQS